MHSNWLIIDGYSLLHRAPDLAGLRERDLMLARQRLVRMIEGVVDRIADRTTLVFDGRRAGPGEEFAGSSVEVLYAPSDKTADTVIERLVLSAPQPGRICVVTSDRGERETVTAGGAQCMSCGQFLDVCDDQRSAVQTRTRRPVEEGPTLGDYFPG